MLRQKDWLRLEKNSEFGHDSLLNFMGERQNFTARAATVVDQHQRVAIVHANIAAAGAFKTTALNEPGGRDLALIIMRCIDRILRQIRVEQAEVSGLQLADHWIFKKAADISNVFWVGKLALPNGNHRIGNLLG